MLQLDLFEQATIEAVKEKVKALAMEGDDLRCPVCNRLVKLYRRKLHAEMVLWLVGLYRLWLEDGWYHTTLEIVERNPYLKAGGTNGTLLTNWGLIEKIPEENRARGPSGSYLITRRGIERRAVT